MKSDATITHTTVIRTLSPTGLNPRATELVCTKLATQEQEALLLRLAVIDKDSELQKPFNLYTLSGS